ncbi:PREDICTED: cylicin-1-like isoform X2 [Camelina sativa]|uniref:Cylicin-1-like isoform X2 n=1 Tax=Camelina sativa TaxID=90675 RepID=A0ABM0W9C4_CAMSA|nr:PREDICTED: cylicin-1-like isoform X2 [Camelina sativa]
MSRCYPFPPPGYVLKEINKDKYLIDSIKGAKDEVKKDRKHKRKDKKRKERETEAGRSRNHRHKRRRKDEGAKLINSEVEFLEKSCQTVELELQSSSQNSCDSTLHSNERSKQIQSQPLDETGLRTRLAEKDPEAEVMMSNKDQKQRFSRERLDASLSAAPKESVGHLYSITQDALRVCQEKRRDPSRDITTELSKDNRKVSRKDTMPSSSLWTHPEEEKPSSSHQETIGPSKLSCKKCPPSMAGQFLNLIDNWTPAPVESKLTDSEDQEWWLFIKFGAKRQQVSNQKTNQGSSSMVWPTARFLPEAELHALPFTVPF